MVVAIYPNKFWQWYKLFMMFDIQDLYTLSPTILMCIFTWMAMNVSMDLSY